MSSFELGDDGQPRPPQRRIAEWVAGYLRDSILGGRLAPGTPLGMAQVAAALKVSTTPVREALLQLQAEGVVKGDTHKSFRVAPLSLDDVRDFHSMHGFIIGVLAERAADTLTEQDLAQLSSIDVTIKEAVARGDFRSVHDDNFKFHRIINHSVHESVMHNLLKITSRHVARRTYPDVPEWLDGAGSDEHKGIIQALAAGDGQTARKLSEEHVRLAGERLIADLRRRGGWLEHREGDAGG